MHNRDPTSTVWTMAIKQEALMTRLRNQNGVVAFLVAVVGALTIGGCVTPYASSPKASNQVTCIATNGGCAQMTVTAQSSQIIWWVQRTADDGTHIPNAPQYFYDLNKAKYSALAEAAKSPPPLYRISGTPNPYRNISGESSAPKIWLDNVSIELATELQQTNNAPIPSP